MKRSFNLVLTNILYVHVTFNPYRRPRRTRKKKNILFKVLVSSRSYDQFLE